MRISQSAWKARRALQKVSIAALTLSVVAVAPPADAASIEVAVSGVGTTAVTAAPFHIDTPFSIPSAASGEGLIDFTGVPTVVVGSSASLGILKAFETTTASGAGLGVNLIVDTDLTFSGSGTVTIGMEAVGRGVVNFPVTSGTSAATFQTLVQGFGTESGSPPGPPFKFGSSGVTTGDPAACLPVACVAALPGQVVPFDSTNFFTESVTNGESQLWSFQLELFMAPQTDLDFFHSADLVFDLPPGVSLHSDLGFTVVGGTAAIPEPSSLLLLSGGLVALVGARRVLRRRLMSKCTADMTRGAAIIAPGSA